MENNPDVFPKVITGFDEMFDDGDEIVLQRTLSDTLMTYAEHLYVLDASFEILHHIEDEEKNPRESSSESP